MMNLQVHKLLSLFFAILQLYTDSINAAITLDNLSCLCGLLNGTKIVKNKPVGCKTLVVPTKSTGYFLTSYFVKTFLKSLRNLTANYLVSNGEMLYLLYDCFGVVNAFGVVRVFPCKNDKSTISFELSEIRYIKGDAALMLIDDSYTYKRWTGIVKEDVQTYSTLIKPLQVDAIAFQFMYSDQLTSLDKTFTNDLIIWLDKLKCLNPEMMFGVILTANLTTIFNSLDIKLLTCHVDFFIFDSKSFIDCLYKKTQAEMEPMVKADALEQRILELQLKGMDLCKLIYTIYIRAHSVIEDDDGQSSWTDYDYSVVCDHQFNPNRRFCIETIENIFMKARLRFKLGALGVLIRDIELDDSLGTCKCQLQGATTPEYPELNIIIGASQENTHSIDYYSCQSGQFPKVPNTE